MTSIILTILQLIGLALAAGAAIANIVKSKGVEEVRTPSLIVGGPEKITRHLTREAKIGVRLLVAGLFVSLAARSLEQYLSHKRNTEQLALLQSSVHEARRLARS